MSGTSVLIHEIIKNVSVCVPVAFLSRIVFKDLEWWKTGLMGTSLSIMIELIHYFPTWGFCKADGVIPKFDRSDYDESN